MISDERAEEIARLARAGQYHEETQEEKRERRMDEIRSRLTPEEIKDAETKAMAASAKTAELVEKYTKNICNLIKKLDDLPDKTSDFLKEGMVGHMLVEFHQEALTALQGMME